MKTHSREEITDQFPNLNLCVVHGKKPGIFKSVVGKSKMTCFTAICESDDCGKIADNAQEVVNYWNTWNPSEPQL